jgi:O-methyltransferase involved in polyketide biosynthesis
MDYEFQKIRQIRMDQDDMTSLILRNREFDRQAGRFMERCPDAVVVHIGCGLDTRFERVDDGGVEWFDLDIPAVIALRKRLLGGESGRYHHLASSVFDLSWFKEIEDYQDRPLLFMAEGVFMYFHAEEIKSLVIALLKRFPGSELVFDAFSPYLVRMNNLRFSMSHFGARYHWGLRRAVDFSCWAEGIRLLDEWSYFDKPEPRLAHIYWMRRIPFLARVLAVYHFQLGHLL